MKNNKGFTLIELIASFTLALIIMFFLFQIVITVKELYVSSGFKTEMLIKQANLEKQLGEDLRSKELTNIKACGEDCYTFYYGSSLQKDLKINHTQNTISYGNYQIALLEGSNIGDLTITKNTIVDVAPSKKNTILTIELPVSNKAVMNQDFGLHMIYQYDNRKLNIEL